MFSYQDANHHTVGPLPGDAIRQLIAAGVIGRHTLMRTLGTDFWQPAAQFAEFKELFDQGRCTVVQGVGYPNPNRSHFKSMDIWHTADTSGTGDGWLGRYVDAEC